MARLFYHTMQDNAGNLLFDVSGTMRLAGTGTLATIYGDEALTVILPNPMTNHPSFGSFKCFLGPGDFDFYMAKAGYTFETLTGVQGYGTLAQQDSHAVTISGGTANFGDVGSPPVGHVLAANGQAILGETGIGQVATAGAWLRVGSTGPGLVVSATNEVGIGTNPVTGHALALNYLHASSHGLVVRPSDGDTGGGLALRFANFAGGDVGSIGTTATLTAYNTTSDARLKKMIEMFDGALDLVHQLRPVRFRWRTDDSEGNGFLANEVKQVLDGVVAGEPDAMNEDGSINPQMIDHSKLVPLLTAALKELSGQVQTLTARVRELELLSVS
jgi:hypothetical protein